MKSRAFGLFVFVLQSCFSFSQVDTEFWFAPPEVTAGHGDRPVYLRISTLDKSAIVTIVQPARGNALIGTANVSANTTHTFDLTGQIGNLETSVPATVMRTGIRITSSAPVNAYYETASYANADIFALKGRNALGNRFVIPAQHFYPNDGYWAPTPSSSFDIVATKNKTIVKVRPTRPIIGHLSDSVITVKLNAGETYSFRKPTLVAEDNPVGTIVESNKPIAITITDDSVITGCADLLGDQLVPLEVAGREYVVLKGFLDIEEYLFITATEDETHLFIDGDVNPVATLSAGQLYNFRITRRSTYILASKTIYVFHITGSGCEVGLAILPSINCKGSRQVGFSRTSSEFFGLNILVRKEGIGHFRLNGSTALVPSSAFTAVRGTHDKWYTAQLNFTQRQLPVGSASLISNDVSSFQIGIITCTDATCGYGYFSSFSTLFIGDDFDICEGEIATLNAGPGKDTYLWNTGSSAMQINISDAGTYWVKVEKEDCILYDTIQVDIKRGEIDLGADVEICKGETVVIDGKENFSWQWSDGSKSRYLNTKQAGKYWLSVFDYTGCQASDTIFVSVKSVVNLGPDVQKCRNDEFVIDAAVAGATYLWQDGTTSSVNVAQDTGIYWCEVTANGCTSRDSLIVENLPGPRQDTIFGSPSVCPGVVDVKYHVEEIPGTTYLWRVNGGVIVYDDGSTIEVDWGRANEKAMVKAYLIDSHGCEGDTLFFPVRINVQLAPQVPAGPDTICLNMSSEVAYTTAHTNGSVYNWFITGGEITAGNGTSQVAVHWPAGYHALWVEESSITTDTVCAGTSEKLFIYVFKDEAVLRLNSLSVDTAAESNVIINWHIDHAERIKENKVYVYKTDGGADGWQRAAEIPAQMTSFTDPGNATDDNVYHYFVTLTNLCEQDLVSIQHNTIRLTGTVDEEHQLIYFSWNSYRGWPTGARYYELWQKLEGGPYRRLAIVPPDDENSYFTPTRTAFEHRYIVNAVDASGAYRSWSNSVDFSFEHEVYIPNVFSPNGDRFNPFFQILNIELFEESHLQVSNRWGKMVFEATDYKNDWDGSDLATGLYFYTLHLRRNSKIILKRGTISIVR